ncbi:hypothetical protein BT96DRAFT_930101, partial [Gymnopus androsaceus JB14]
MIPVLILDVAYAVPSNYHLLILRTFHLEPCARPSYTPNDSATDHSRLLLWINNREDYILDLFATRVKISPSTLVTNITAVKKSG